MNWFNNLLGWHDNPMIIAIAHLVFNIVNSFAFLLLIKPLTFVCNKIVKGDDSGVTIQEKLLDYSLIKKSPSLAFEFVKTAVNYMAICVKDYLNLAYKYSFVRVDSLISKGDELEKTINSLDKRIHDYLIKLTVAFINKETSSYLSKYFIGFIITFISFNYISSSVNWKSSISHISISFSVSSINILFILS